MAPIIILGLSLGICSYAAEEEHANRISGGFYAAAKSRMMNKSAFCDSVKEQEAIHAAYASKIEEIEEAERLEEAEDKELLASIIFCEAGNQSFTGQVAVGAVVLNRMENAAYPDTMEEVIYQPGQFCPAGSGWLDRVRNTDGYTDSAMEAAEAALDGKNPIGDCLYFDQGGYGYQIGAHYFH